MNKIQKKSHPDQAEIRLAKKLWGNIAPPAANRLKDLVNRQGLRVSSGDFILLDGNLYVTHSGLLNLSSRKGCAGIHVRPVPEFSEPTSQRWAFEATAYKSRTCRGFVGYGDADPSNVSPLVHGAEMRVAETRAVNRALRKAYGIGICSVEEIGSSAQLGSSQQPKKMPSQPVNENYGGPKVRDRLCQIIRQHHLDAELVKAYATDFCGVKSLREASRKQVENFVQQLADWAEKDRNALLCQLNSYLSNQPKEGAA